MTSGTTAESARQVALATNGYGTWWARYTVHNDDYTKQGVRVCLGTDDVEIARALRDFIMQATPKIAGSIPRSRGQAMPDVAPPFTSGRNRGSALNACFVTDR